MAMDIDRGDVYWT